MSFSHIKVFLIAAFFLTITKEVTSEPSRKPMQRKNDTPLDTGGNVFIFFSKVYTKQHGTKPPTYTNVSDAR